MQTRQLSQMDPAAAPDRWVASTCGFCSVGCGVEIGVMGGEIVGVRGREDHPVNRGRLGPKGLNQYYANRHATRAHYPMVRDGNGELVRASWDEAMQRITEKLGQVLATDGADAVAIYNSGQLLLEEYYTLGKIARAGLGTPNIDSNTRLCTATTAASLTDSFGADGPPAGYEDLDLTECIVLVGHNAAEQSTVLWMRIQAQRDRPDPPRIIVVDPRRTFTVQTGADLHLALQPGTNVALLNGLCHLLIENGWVDREFIDRHTEGYERFRATVSGYTPEVVEGICGVPAADLRKAAEWIGMSRSTVTTCLQGVYQSNQATVAACTVNSMHLLMGKIGKPGSAPFQFAGQPSSMNTRECGADGSYPAYRNWQNPRHMRDLAKRWNVPVERLGQKPVSAPEIFEGCAEGQIKILWNICTNPAVSMMSREKHLRTLRGVFLIVQDCFADTETARLADVFLPAAMWGEKTGCMTNAERRCNLLQKAVEPPGEARADLDIFLDFARRMDFRDRSGQPLIGYADARGAFDEWREISRGTIPDYSGMTYEKLLERGGIQWPCNAEFPEGRTRLYTAPHFPTEEQRAEVWEYDLRSGHERSVRDYRSHADTGGRARLLAAEFEPPADHTDAEYPLRAISGRQAYHWHTRTKTGKSPALTAGAPDVFIAVNDSDAAHYGIADGDTVRVVSRRGFVEGPAKVGDVVREGAVFVPWHYGELDRNAAANNLTPELWDPASKQPIQKGSAVRLERVSDGAGAPWWRDPAPAGRVEMR